MNIPSQVTNAYNKLLPLTKTIYVKSKAIDITSKEFLLSTGVILLVMIGALIGYRILRPFDPVVSDDLDPFTSVAEYESFVADNPLLAAEVPHDRKFTVSRKIRADKSILYTIELQSRPIKPEMNDVYIQSYLSVLEDSQKDALDWIRSQGEDPDKLAIVWRPNPQLRRSQLLGDSTRQSPQKNSSNTTTSPTPTPTPSPTPTMAPTPTPSSGGNAAPPPGRFPQ